jgi:hypothetical protein
MNVLNIAYKGQGSEKQVAWATDIFNKKMLTLKGEYDYAMQRVAEGNMPESYKDAWELVLKSEKVIRFVESVAACSAKTMIDYKGCPNNKCFATILKTLAHSEYNKAA